MHDEIAEMFDALSAHGGCSSYALDPITGTQLEEARAAQLINPGIGTDDDQAEGKV